jgi:uncharacterized protein YxeA
MKKLNKKGFGVVEVLLIFVIVALIGGVGFYIYSKNQNDNTDKLLSDITVNLQKKEEPKQKTVDPYADWKSYSRYGVTLKYPEDWSVKAHNNTQAQNTDLTSPDFPGSDSAPTGQRVSFGETKFPQTDLTADNFKTSHLDPNPNPYSEYKKLTINGKKAIQFYRGDARTTVFFLPGNKTITFDLDTFPNRADNSSEYNKIVESVTFN